MESDELCGERMHGLMTDDKTWWCVLELQDKVPCSQRW